MKLHITTDYAIRIIGYLYQNQNRLSTAMEMSQKLGITYQYFMKIAHRLKKAGIICSEQGSNGGYRLLCDPDQTTLYDIISVMEGEIRLNSCLGSDGYCSMECQGHCPVHAFFEQFQAEVEERLQSETLSSIWSNKATRIIA